MWWAGELYWVHRFAEELQTGLAGQGQQFDSVEPPESWLPALGGEDMLWVGRAGTGASRQLILTAASGTSCTCWGLLCCLGCWRSPWWWDRKTSRCAEGTKFSCIHSEKHRGGQSVQAPTRSWELSVHTESFLGVLQALSSTSLLTQTTLLLPIPGHTHHTWRRLRPEPCSWLPRQKRQWESSKPIARTISHGERNIYLGNTFNLHTAVNFHPLQQRTARYKISQEQKIQPWTCRGVQDKWAGQSDSRGIHVQEKHSKAEPSQEAKQ